MKFWNLQLKRNSLFSSVSSAGELRPDAIDPEANGRLFGSVPTETDHILEVRMAAQIDDAVTDLAIDFQNFLLSIFTRPLLKHVSFSVDEMPLLKSDPQLALDNLLRVSQVLDFQFVHLTFVQVGDWRLMQLCGRGRGGLQDVSERIEIRFRFGRPRDGAVRNRTLKLQNDLLKCGSEFAAFGWIFLNEFRYFSGFDLGQRVLFLL